MGGRELLNRKSIYRTALLKMSSELSRCVPGTAAANLNCNHLQIVPMIPISRNG